MKNQDSNAVFSGSNLARNHSSEKASLLNNFIDWFRDFLDNAE
ncbi:hypothetical protein [Polaribacter sargassicola]|nr:hypothetical protein [Polaribacter sp. DS7-9]